MSIQVIICSQGEALAEEGHFVDAIELTPNYVKQMREKFSGNDHIGVYEGNAKDLGFLETNT